MTNYPIGTIITDGVRKYKVVDKNKTKIPSNHENPEGNCFLTERSDHGGWGEDKKYWWLHNQYANDYKVISMEKITLKEFLEEE